MICAAVIASGLVEEAENAALAAARSIRTSYCSSTGSQADAVAWSNSGPSVSASLALGATRYQPEPISETMPIGLAKLPPFLRMVTVGDFPVAPVRWSDERTSRKARSSVLFD